MLLSRHILGVLIKRCSWEQSSRRAQGTKSPGVPVSQENLGLQCALLLMTRAHLFLAYFLKKFIVYFILCHFISVLKSTKNFIFCWCISGSVQEAKHVKALNSSVSHKEKVACLQWGSSGIWVSLSKWKNSSQCGVRDLRWVLKKEKKLFFNHVSRDSFRLKEQFNN